MSISATEAEELVSAIAETSPAMLWMGDAQGKCSFLNAALRKFWGVSPARLEDFDWTSTLHPEDIDMLTGPFGQAMADHSPMVVQARYRRADGAYRTMRTEANPRFSKDGKFLGMTGVNTDITDQLAAEEHNKMLMGELNHRTKNILAVVQALARQTAKGEEPDAFLKIFDERLRGLAASNDLLLRNDWVGVCLDELIRVQLSHIPDLLGSRLTTIGPELNIPASGAQTLGMAIHELTTNSLKYGALAHPNGRVHLSWRNRETQGWTIEWREESPVAPKAPAHHGFGRRLIVDMVASAFGAEVTVDYATPGFRWVVEAPPRVSP